MGYLDQFYHYRMGKPESPKLVFLHGLLGFSANWRKIARAFEPTHEILVYDQRGHGRSVKPTHGYRPEDFADDLLKIIDELGWDKINLVGHSMGGRNALIFAHRHSKRVDKLVIEDIGPESNPADIDKFKELFASIPTPFASREAARNFFQNEFKDPALGPYLLANIEEDSDKTCDWRFSKSAMIEVVAEGRSRDHWDEIEGLKIPTLLIRGQDTGELSPLIYERVLQCNPNIRGLEIPGAGHWVHFDKPEAFIAGLSEFLGKK